MHDIDKEEEEIVRLSQIFETLKKDAIEVSDLLVKGIEYYRIVAYILLVIGIIPLWNLGTSITSSDILNSLLYGFFIVVDFGGILFFLYKNRKLKKKYEELIEIHKSLTEE